MFDVILSPEAQAFYADADLPQARKFAHCFAQPEHDPKRHNNIKRLTGAFAGRFRYRVGDWRVIYAVNDKAQTVNILLIAHRSEVYE